MKDEELMKKFVELFGEKYSDDNYIKSWVTSRNKSWDYWYFIGEWGLWDGILEDYLLDWENSRLFIRLL